MTQPFRCTAVLAIALAACARPATTPAPAPAAAPPPASPAEPAPAPAPATVAVSEGPGRALTTAELALVRPIFRDSVDYAAVRVLDERYTFLQPENTYMTPDGYIYAPGRLWREDFASADAYLQAVFVHEMVHVWQFQSGKDLVAEGIATFATNLGAYERAYAYELDATRDLLDYGMEQQASIVEDWHLVRAGYQPRRLVDLSTAPRYADVLRAFVADPRYALARSTDDVARVHAEEAGSSLAQSRDPTAPDAAAHMCDWRFAKQRRSRK